MTTEYILLLGIFAFVLIGVFMNGPKETFEESGPRLAVHVERQLETGSGFVPAGGAKILWHAP